MGECDRGDLVGARRGRTGSRRVFRASTDRSSTRPRRRRGRVDGRDRLDPRRGAPCTRRSCRRACCPTATAAAGPTVHCVAFTATTARGSSRRWGGIHRTGTCRLPGRVGHLGRRQVRREYARGVGRCHRGRHSCRAVPSQICGDGSLADGSRWRSSRSSSPRGVIATRGEDSRSVSFRRFAFAYPRATHRPEERCDDCGNGQPVRCEQNHDEQHAPRRGVKPPRRPAVNEKPGHSPPETRSRTSDGRVSRDRMKAT